MINSPQDTNLKDKLKSLNFGDEPKHSSVVIPSTRLRLHADGSANPNPGPVKVGLTLYLDNDKLWEKTIDGGYGTNNASEFIALIKACQFLKQTFDTIPELRQYTCSFLSDSRLSVNAISKIRPPKNTELLALYNTYKEEYKKLNKEIPLYWIPRSFNITADSASKQGQSFIQQVLREKGLVTS